MNVIQNHELRALVAMAQAQGWRVDHCSSGHVRFIPPQRELGMVIAPKTTSDHRGMANTRAQLARRGLIVPEGKKGR